jgi:hypothetical protein
MTNVPEVIDLYTYTHQTYAPHVCVLFSSRKNRQAEKKKKTKKRIKSFTLNSLEEFYFFRHKKNKNTKEFYTEL